MKSEQTLKEWAGYTLAKRAVAFHRRFTDKWISATKLARLYQLHKITRKKVRAYKVPSSANMVAHIIKVSQCRRELEEAISRQLPVVYIDETVFTK